MFSNRLIIVGILAEVAIILLIVHTPLGNALFGTAPLPAELWLLPVPFAFGMLALEEARKWAARRRGGDGAGSAPDDASRPDSGTS